MNNKGHNDKKTFMMQKKYIDKQTNVQTHIYTLSHSRTNTHALMRAHTDILLPLKDVVQTMKQNARLLDKDNDTSLMLSSSVVGWP